MLSKIKSFFNSLINHNEKYVVIFIDSSKTTSDENSVSSSVKATNMESSVRSKVKGETYADLINGTCVLLLEPFMVSLEDVLVMINIEFDEPYIYINKNFNIIVDMNREVELINDTIEDFKELQFSKSFKCKNVIEERMISNLFG